MVSLWPLSMPAEPQQRWKPVEERKTHFTSWRNVSGLAPQGLMLGKSLPLKLHIHNLKEKRQKEKGATKDEMVSQHHWLNGHEFEQTPGDSRGQRSLAGCSPWGRRESDTTQRLHFALTMGWCPVLCVVSIFPALFIERTGLSPVYLLRSSLVNWLTTGL